MLFWMNISMARMCEMCDVCTCENIYYACVCAFAIMSTNKYGGRPRETPKLCVNTLVIAPGTHPAPQTA